MSDDISIPPISRGAGPVPARTSFTHSYRARRAGMDETTKRLLVGAGALGFLLLAGMGAWSAMGRHSSGVPVVEADARPLRVKPDNPGGMQVVGANEQIMNGEAGSGADLMGPGAEAPDPQALRAQTAPRAAAPAEAGALAVAPGVVAPAVAAPPVVAPPVVAPAVVAPAVVAPAGTGGAAGGASPLPDTPAAAGRVARGAAAVRPAAGDGQMVQIAALESEAAAKLEWQRLAKRMPDVLGGREPVVQRAERDGHAVWRVRLGGFGDMAEATAFCGRVRAKGGACSLASF